MLVLDQFEGDPVRPIAWICPD